MGPTMATQAKPIENKDLRHGRRILVVEDERDIADMLRFNLERAGFTVSMASDGRTALRLVADFQPELILLDLMIPEIPGTEVATRVRATAATAAIPIIMLTAKSDEVDQVVGLTVGADDYITKPFSMKVLMARVETVLRRAAGTSSGVGKLRIGGIEMDPDTHEVFVNSEPAKLTLTEFKLLSALISAGGRVLSRHHLMGKAMGPGVTVTERTIDVHITAIRKKLGDQGALIKTVRGVGYRITQEETSEV